VIFNTFIFVSVKSSTRRLRALATTTNSLSNSNNHSARDIHLLKHMFFIFVVFMLGWIPISTVRLFPLNDERSLTISQYLVFLPVISSIITVLDLFLYNRDLTQYLKEKILNRFHINRNLNK
jgi:hypothetical protein